MFMVNCMFQKLSFIFNRLELLDGMENTTLQHIKRTKSVVGHGLVGLARNIGSNYLVRKFSDQVVSLVYNYSLLC